MASGLPAEVAKPRRNLEAWVKASARGGSSTLLCVRKRWTLATFTGIGIRRPGLIARRLNSLTMAVW
jgi:hypothetical protein